MNLEVFNRVNWKESYHSNRRNQNSVNGMYSKWTSLTNNLHNRSCNENLEEESVLCKFSPSAGKQVTVFIVKQLASNLGITQPAELSNLSLEKEIFWCMEIICYGLTLPLTEHDIVRDCVNIYCEWLSALHPVPKISVPVPVCNDPNFFVRKIIAHFLNLFMPRNGEGSDIINKQAVLCHRVLRTLQQVTQVSKNIENDTWQTLLLFLLTINDTLLAPPTVKDDVGDQLCERVLSVLLEVWLIACIKCYPPPPLWKTLREMATNWRHRTALLEQWNRINLSLTSRLLEIMYGLSFPQLKIGGDEDLQNTVNNMTEECVVQTWFRMLHTIGNPVDLCHSNIISQTPQFLQYAITNDNPLEHPSLSILPLNFFKAIKGIASLVDAFLGIPGFVQWEDYSSYSSAVTCQQLQNYGNSSNVTSPNLPGTASELSSPTPPSRRRLAKSFSVTSTKGLPKSSSAVLTTNRLSTVAAGTTGGGSSTPSQNASSFNSSSLNYISYGTTSNRNTLLSPLRPKCNSVLHLFGEWLFEAAYNSDLSRISQSSVAGGITGVAMKNIHWPTSGEAGSISSGSVSSILMRKSSSSQLNSLTTDSSDDTGTSTPAASSLVFTNFPTYYDKFVSGRAEAVGTLCRIFCAKKTGEEILPIYLSRFYMIVQQSLRVKEYGECDEIMASVLLNSADIFSSDLDGVLLLVPYFIEALEIVLPEKNLKFNESSTLTTSNTAAFPSMSNTVTTTVTSSMTNTSSNVATTIILAGSQTNAGSAATATGVSTASTSTVVVTSAVTTFTVAVPIMTPATSTMSVVGPSGGNAFNPINDSCDNSISSITSDADSATVTNLASGNSVTTSAASSMSANVTSNATSSVNAITTTAPTPLVELRKACIRLLLSVLPLPLHFQNLPIKDFGNVLYKIHTSSTCNITFGQLKPRLVNLLISALQVETDSCNTQLLLGGLLFIIQDFSLCEQTNVSNSSQIDNSSETSSNSNVLAFDTAHSLFVRGMYLVCHRLISSWKMDLNVSLAALEFLTCLARIRIREMDILECKRAVKWLCDFIVYQCGRPPQAHSKDLHSSIVAALQCAAHWLISYAFLLKDKECLNTLLEVVELGISGTKSQGKLNEPIRMKDEKELKPVSMRVRDAAEALLTTILEQTDSNASSVMCLLDEVILVKQCNSLSSVFKNSDDDLVNYDQAVSKFHYFMFENNIIALLQEPFGNDQDPQPTVTLLIRNSFGRYAWTLQLRHLPRHRSMAKQCYNNSTSSTTGRPISMSETFFVPITQQRYFPDCVNKIEAYKADKSIPSLESIDCNESDNKLQSLIEQQYTYETDANCIVKESFEECNPPSTCHEFYTARMFLCHLGLLSRFRSGNKQQHENCSLIALDNHEEEFARELKKLDEITRRTYDTCHVFYVRAGQRRHLDILENAMSVSNVSQNFVELLYSLGWPVKVDRHIGWTGHASTSYKISYGSKLANGNENNETSEEKEDGSCTYDGTKRILYWADLNSEIAFVVPSLRQQSSIEQNADKWYERNITAGNETNSIDRVSESSSTSKIRTLSLDTSTCDPKPQSNISSVFVKKKSNLVTVVMLVWLESFEDHAHFPLNELLPYTNTGVESNNKIDALRDCFVIFLHALQNGLLRIKLQGPEKRINVTSPLVDGMIISRRSAGQLIREAVLNICRRRRLDSDSYQLPHVRRRLKLQEIKDKFECKMNQSELLTYLLTHC